VIFLKLVGFDNKNEFLFWKSKAIVSWDESPEAEPDARIKAPHSAPKNAYSGVSSLSRTKAFSQMSHAPGAPMTHCHIDFSIPRLRESGV